MPYTDLCVPILESFEVIIPLQYYEDIHDTLLVFQGGIPKLKYVKTEGHLLPASSFIHCFLFHLHC